MPIVTMPDGTNVSFPDDMPAEQIRSMIAQKFPNETGGIDQPAAVPAQVAPPVQDPNLVKGSILPMSRNRMTGETSLDMSAGIPGMVQQGIQKFTAGLQPQQTEVPGMLSEVDVARQQIGERQKIEGAAEVAALASPMSAGSRVAASAAAAGVKAAKPALPEIEALKESARASYKVVDDAGVVVSPKSFGPVVEDIARTLIKEGLDPTNTPGATAALKRLVEVRNEPVTLSTIDTLRQIARDAAKSKTHEADTRLGGITVDMIDDFVRGIGIKDVVVSAENPSVATKALTEARGLWHSAKKSEKVEELVERAATRAGQFSGSGFENALRTEFRNFVMNKNNLRGWSKEEADAAKKVARGGAVDNLVRWLGKLAPTGVVSGAVSGGAGAAIGGGIGAVALPVAGFAARQYATKRTKDNVEKVRELVRGAQREPSGRAADNTKEILRNILARSRVFGGGQALLAPTPRQ
jgi:hypothetical protein